MISRLASLVLAATLWVAAFGAAPNPAAAQTSALGRVEAQPAQILVMLRLPPAHSRPGANYAGGYGDGAGAAARRRIAQQLARQHGLTLASEWPMPVLGVDCFVMTAPGTVSAQSAAADLSRDPAVAWSEPMHTFRAEARTPATPMAAPTPNDPLFPAQPAAKTWRLAELHEIATGRGVKVAVVDSRVDLQHPDLVGQVQLSRDFLPDHPAEAESHGTAVAAIIAALGNNHAGIVGVAPGARLMALRACWQAPTGGATTCDTLSLARAIDFAVENSAQVINLSLAGPPDTLLGKLIDVALARGALVVGAVDPNLAQGGFPASHAGVIAVAVEGAGEPARGVLVAPGRDVPTAEPHGRWALVNGSSFAAAHVTGLAALMREKNPRADRAGFVVARGGGEIDACATLLRAAGPCGSCTCARISGPRTGEAH